MDSALLKKAMLENADEITRLQSRIHETVKLRNQSREQWAKWERACADLDMTRQGVTQHLDLLEAANLVATARRGREKLHFLNPVPLQEIYERWIAKFEKPRLKALSNLKKRLEKADD